MDRTITFEWELDELVESYSSSDFDNYRAVVIGHRDWEYEPLSEWWYNHG